MKKAITIIIALFVSIVSFGQKYFNFTNNRNIEMSFGFSNITNPSTKENIGEISIAGFLSNSYAPQGKITGYFFDISTYGVYFSVNCWSSLNTGASHSLSIDRDMPEGRCSIIHFGYKSPVTNWLYVYPIIGHVSLSTGYCNGSIYNIDSSGNIHNRYTPMWGFETFDYGAGIDFKIGNYFLVSGKFTKMTMGISFGFVIDFNRFYF